MIERREIPIVSCHPPGQFPYSFDRIQIRTVRWQKFGLKSRLCSLPPIFMQCRMMMSNVIGDHEYLPVGAQTDVPQLLKEGKAGFGIKSTVFAPVYQLAVSQSHGNKISNTSACRVMQQHRIRALRWNPHPTSRTILLKVNLIHRPKINAWTSCQAPEFILPGPDPQGLHWQSGALVCEGETRADGKVAGTVVFQGPHPIGFLRMWIASFRPKGCRSVQNPLDICAKLHRSCRSVPHLIVVAGQVAPPPSAQSTCHVQIDQPNTLRFEGHLQIDPILGGNSYPGRRAAPRAGDSHIVIPRSVGFHLGVRGRPSQHPLSLVASCRKSITM
jgi:hypothetical protein